MAHCRVDLARLGFTDWIVNIDLIGPPVLRWNFHIRDCDVSGCGKVLIIEDVVFRQQYLSKLIEADEIDCARRADKALGFLYQKNYDVVFLDHDLIGAISGSNITMEWAGNTDTIKTKSL